jgi:tRNA G10  N-methylase Trm11
LAGYPNLSNAAECYVLAELENGWVFGRLVASPDRLYLAHTGKPFHTSSSLPSRVARALVNLAAQPGSLLLNPFCGTGSLLLEACAVGLSVQGADKNSSMVEMSQENLAHFGYVCSIETMDVRQWSVKGGALVADLPYDKNSEVSDDELCSILAWGAQASPLGVYAAGRDLTTELLDVGYARVEIFRVSKRKGFTRFVHRCRH